MTKRLENNNIRPHIKYNNIIYLCVCTFVHEVLQALQELSNQTWHTGIY